MERDVLYLPCTRAARTVGGVPAMGFGMNFLVCYLGYMIPGAADFIHFRGWGWIVCGIAAHYGMRWAVERDPNIFRVLQVTFDTLSLSQTIWAAPSRLPRKARKMVSAV